MSGRESDLFSLFSSVLRRENIFFESVSASFHTPVLVVGGRENENYMQKANVSRAWGWEIITIKLRTYKVEEVEEEEEDIYAHFQRLEALYNFIKQKHATI